MARSLPLPGRTRFARRGLLLAATAGLAACGRKPAVLKPPAEPKPAEPRQGQGQSGQEGGTP